MLTTRVVDFTPDLLRLQSEWEALRKECHGSIFTSFDWTIEWLRHFDLVASPRIVLVEERGDLIAIAPFVVMEHRALGMKLKKLALVGNGGSVAQLYDLRILSRGNTEEVLEVIIEALDELDWNVIHLDGMCDDDLTLSFYDRLSERWETDELVRVPCPRAELPADGDLLEVISVGTRRIIKRSVNSLENDSRIGYRIVDLPDEAAEAVEIFALRHMDRWENKDGLLFGHEQMTSFLKDVIMASAQEGRGLVYEVWIDGSLASQMICLEDRDCMRSFRVGMTDRYADFAPAHLVAYFAMTEARKAGFSHFDFGSGLEEFKYRLDDSGRSFVGIQAKRGSVRAMSKLSSLPGVRQLIERNGNRQMALKASRD
jgi:CelD/BcsL family acetyltransferase involved in cellulose biosynthesis